MVFMQQQNVFFLDTCFWLISAIIFYLTYPMIYHIMWAMKKEDMKYIIKWTGKTPAQLNKHIDKLKDTREWKSAVETFTAKAMKVISKL